MGSRGTTPRKRSVGPFVCTQHMEPAPFLLGGVKIPEQGPAAPPGLLLAATGGGTSGLPIPEAREDAKKPSPCTAAPSDAPAPGHPHLPCGAADPL